MKALAWAVVLMLAPGLAAAQVSLTGRSTNVFGNFLVGSGSLFDSGSFNELLSTLDAGYDQQAADGGAVNGVFGGQPVQGSASFASETRYQLSGLQIVGDGLAATTGDTPYAYVSLGANAISNLRLDIEVPVITRYLLAGSVLRELGPDVGTRSSAAQASVQFTAPGASTWNADTAPGAFQATGTLLPGSSYRLTGNASSRLNGEARYSFSLVLSPVPEPAPWLLLAGALACRSLGRRRRAMSGP